MSKASDPTSGQKRLELDQVYVALDTTAPLFEEKLADSQGRPFLRPPTKTEERRLSVLEATVVRRRLVLRAILAPANPPSSATLAFVSLRMVWTPRWLAEALAGLAEG